MVAMNDLILYRRNRWFMGVLRSPMTRRLTLSHLLVVVLPAAGDILSAFWSNAIQRCAWGDEIRIWTQVQDRMVVVVVEDTGPPLPDGVNQCLCGAGDPAALRAQEVEGFTTGLAEVAQIVAAHSGVIRAEPVQPPGAGPAFGARFLFGLPV